MTAALIILGVLAALALFGALWSYRLQIESLWVTVPDLPPALEGLRIVQVSDLHLPRQGLAIPALLTAVRSARPDLIAITGDLVDKRSELDRPALREVCEGLAQIAPCYAVTGNHEWEGHWVEAVRAAYTASNICFLDGQRVTFEKEGAALQLLGLANAARYRSRDFPGLRADAPRVLLAHHPERIDDYAAPAHVLRPHLVLCGHAHGGQVCIPFTRQGLYAPHQGFFPRYTSGLYQKRDVVLAVSRGLGNSLCPIRMFDRFHLPVLHLTGSPK